jgi:hypothetical protein
VPWFIHTKDNRPVFFEQRLARRQREPGKRCDMFGSVGNTHSGPMDSLRGVGNP